MDKIEIDFEVVGAPCTSDTERFTPDNPLNRPEIHYKNFALALIGFIILGIALFTVSHRLLTLSGAENTAAYALLCTAPVLLIYLYAISKKAVIWCVRVYQHYAPDYVRLRCVFEPSCSEYMILAVEKYGTVIGVIKGIRRLMRCHQPGGIDYP